MTTFVFPIVLVGAHTIVAWLLIEVFVNVFHGLSRRWYVVLHYCALMAAFAIVFLAYFYFFAAFSAFITMVIAISTLLIIEVIIFRYMYSGELWFLNYTDWIVPLFLAASTVYFAGMIQGY
jgi:hypothetical protein